MLTTVSSPAKIGKKYGIKGNSKLQWMAHRIISRQIQRLGSGESAAGNPEGGKGTENVSYISKIKFGVCMFDRWIVYVWQPVGARGRHLL